MKVAERAGNARGTGARRSFRWQKSVGRISRLVLREVARPPWRARALARRKLEAPPDAGPEPREGEAVCGSSAHDETYVLLRLVGLGPQALDTTEGALGPKPI